MKAFIDTTEAVVLSITFTKRVTAQLKIMLLGILLSFVVTPVLSARILGIISTPSYSHQIAFHPLWRELSLKGHQLTVLTTDPINNPLLGNLTEINLHSVAYKKSNKMNMVDLSEKSTFALFQAGKEVAEIMVEEVLGHPEVQALIKNKTEHFDLLLVETMFPIMYAFAARFKCPFIGISSLEASTYVYNAIGNPAHPVLNPDYMLSFAGKLTFFERLISTVFVISMQCFLKISPYSSQQLLIEKHFGNGYPLLAETVGNMSMLFTNTNPIFHEIRPLLPTVVQIGGGTHLQSSKPLPKDLQKHLDNANQGFIYFSLGTNVKSKDLTESKRRILLETFSELPYEVLWKFEEDDLPGKPNNVIISKWFPQQDIFRHPNIKLFITQGGLQSMEEAIYSQVPLIGIPFFGDQPINVKKMVAKGIGLSVDYATLDKVSFKEAVLDVINNPKYRNKAKELAEVAKDQPMTGLERAVWWTEYVLRHKGARHLRSPAIDLPFYQYFLLDVAGFCVLVMVTATLLLVAAVKFILKLLRFFVTKAKTKMS